MLRHLLVGISAATLLQAGGADARGHGGSSHSSTRSSSSSHSHSSSTRSTSTTRAHHSRSSETRSTVHHSRSNRTTKRDPAQRRAFQKSHPCPSTGRTSGACPGYRVDHIKALKRGGADRPSNMQWQTIAEAKAKDRWE